MTEKEYKDVDNKMLKAAELRKAVHDTKDGVEWTNTEMPGFVRVAWCDIPKFEE